MEKDGLTRVYVGHPLRVIDGNATRVSATEVYPAKGHFADDDEERAMGVWANADVQLMGARFYANDNGDVIASTLVRAMCAGIIYETRDPIQVEEGLVEAILGGRSEYEMIARSIESQLGRTGLTIICE